MNCLWLVVAKKDPETWHGKQLNSEDRGVGGSVKLPLPGKIDE